MNSIDYFKENHFLYVTNFISPEVCNLLYHHVKLEAKRLEYLEYDLGDDIVDKERDNLGTFKDSQAPGDFSKYGDPIFEALLDNKCKKMSEITGINLNPTYSYHRLYTTGTELKRHKDRPSCEISTTLCLGFDNSNLKKEYNWPMFVGPKTGELGTEGTPIYMQPGDMIIYRGCELEHWREPLKGLNHAQVFLHYNEAGGEYDIMYDGRPMLGLPTRFKK